MSLTLHPATPRVLKNVLNTGLFSCKTFARILHITFIRGPRMMITKGLSAKSASMMIMLCAPALLFSVLMTVPPLLFPDPEQYAYFYFSQFLNHDPSRWIGLLLAGTCAVVALAVPAAAPEPYNSVRF